MPARKNRPAAKVEQVAEPVEAQAEAAEEIDVEKPPARKRFVNSTFADRAKAAGRNKRVSTADGK